jgi:hypothetical protein
LIDPCPHQVEQVQKNESLDRCIDVVDSWLDASNLVDIQVANLMAI